MDVREVGPEKFVGRLRGLMHLFSLCNGSLCHAFETQPLGGKLSSELVFHDINLPVEGC